MSNLTITVDDNSLQKARIKAMEQGTSLNAVLREFIESFAGASDRQKRAVDEILKLSNQATSRRGEASWTRDELHER
jgi:hypothetical protein